MSSTRNTATHSRTGRGLSRRFLNCFASCAASTPGLWAPHCSSQEGASTPGPRSSSRRLETRGWMKRPKKSSAHYSRRLGSLRLPETRSRTAIRPTRSRNGVEWQGWRIKEGEEAHKAGGIGIVELRNAALNFSRLELYAERTRSLVANWRAGHEMPLEEHLEPTTSSFRRPDRRSNLAAPSITSSVRTAGLSPTRWHMITAFSSI